MRCMFHRVRYQYQLEECWSSVDLCLPPEITQRSNQQVWDLDDLEWSFYANLLTPKVGSSFTLESLTNRSRQINLRSLLSPCFAVVVYNENWWPMFNVHLTYKFPSSWMILFWFGGYPRQFSTLKKFRALVVPGGGFHMGIILQGRQLKYRVSCVRQDMPDKRRICNKSVCTCTKSE